LAGRRRGRGEGGISRRKDGRWTGQYTLETAAGTKRKSVYGKTRREVAAKLTKAIADRDNGLVFEGGNIQTGAYLGRWLQDTLQSRTKTARMKAGGSFSLLSLVSLLGAHGPELEVDTSGPDSEHAFDCIAAILNGETTDLTPADRELLRGRGRYQRAILADLPPPASARWLAWLREDPTRKLPWDDEPLPKDHKHPYPYTQARGGLKINEAVRMLNSLPKEERAMVKKWHVLKQDEYLCAPDEVRREMLAAHAA
jgi:hypothetical protein